MTTTSPVPPRARVTGLASMATRDVLADLARAWREQGRGEVAFESVGGVDAARRIQAGEAFDVVVLARAALDTLVAAGRVAPASITDLMRSDVAIAVRAGARRPAIDSEDALRRTVLAAAGVGYSTGPSGVALLQLFERWGIAETLRERLVQARPGVPVASLLANGTVELGFQQRSELMHAEGVDVIGPMPPGIGIVTTFSGGVCAAASNPARARELLDFIGSPAGAAIVRRHAMQPVPPHPRG